MKLKIAPKKAASGKSKKVFRFKLLDTFITLLFLLLSGLVVFTAIRPAYDTQLKQRKEKQRLAARLSSVKEKNRGIEEEIGRLQTDDYIECLARKDFGLVKPGESAYVVVPASNDDEIRPVVKPVKEEKPPATLWERISSFFQELLP